MTDKYLKILEKIQEADSIVIGASNGLSISEGYNIFVDDLSFRENFGDFREKYNFYNIIQGCFYSYPSEEEKWTFFSRMFEYFLYDKKPSMIMKNLYKLVKDKNYFVVTSNIDDHFTLSGFSKERLFEIEGNCRYLQCSDVCHDKIYFGDEILSKMAENQDNGKIPLELIPKCPKCGGKMQVHIEIDRSFLKDQSWQSSYKGYQDFINNSHNKKLVFLELGVGAKNQMIKAPFMNLVNHEKQATYITVNKGEIYIPNEIYAKSIGIDDDIEKVLRQLVKMKQSV
ncbi:Sir2 family NAD-dependent protein deacetylase [Clostridium felsineum]|uniref:protein acetyllysine N-acetyltransferase n=1 Tax=Clostridium felsineum TaxID=36839 RepID=A0A1S8LSQ2_9CLOT|nr:Sir2 family NAD-dependent protein deacetylase [Clostridium felsineum]URZ05191.1 Protein ADP-ribosyltransferase [Clostridium felsineum]URZ10232.1 Protein ADP-ribosyltransferase [Clostridium felsineum]